MLFAVRLILNAEEGGGVDGDEHFGAVRGVEEFAAFFADFDGALEDGLGGGGAEADD